MIALSSTATVFKPIVPTIRPILENGTFNGVDQTQVVLFEMPLAWFIASFFLMSSIAHAAAGWPLRDRYEGFLARGMNPLRWVEYAFSSTVMISRSRTCRTSPTFRRSSRSPAATSR